MSAVNFGPALAFTLQSEGGFSDDPHDPGGATMDGITLTEFQAFYRFSPPATVANLKEITNAQVQEIYLDNYWQVVQGDELPPGVDLSVFDMAVNAGTVQSVKFLQRIVFAEPALMLSIAQQNTAADGIVGPVTLAAVLRVNDPIAIISSLYTKQMTFYASLSTFQYFGKGWTARCVARRQAAISLAGEVAMMSAKAYGKALP